VGLAFLASERPAVGGTREGIRVIDLQVIVGVPKDNIKSLIIIN
jgi:hypothetical protein